MAESIRQKAFSAIRWSGFSTGATMCVQMAVMVVMARLLDPSTFGLMAMTEVVIRFAAYVAQMGIGPVIIQKEELTPEQIGATFWISLGLGLFFFLLAYAAAPIAAAAFREPRLTPLLRLSAITFVTTGAGITALNILRRELRFRELALVDLLSLGIGSGIVGIPCAYFGLGVWSLVIALITRGAISAGVSYALCPHRIPLPADPAVYRGLYSLGTRYSLTSFLDFVGSNLDSVLIGRIGGDVVLGLYNRASRIAFLPVEMVVSSLSRVLFPFYSRLQGQTEKLHRAYGSAFLAAGVFAGCVAFGISPAAEEIVLVILGPKWTPSIPILRVLVFAVPLSVLSHVSSQLLDATATLKQKMSAQACTILATCILMAAMSPYGPVGFAAALVLAQSFNCIALGIIAHLKVSGTVRGTMGRTSAILLSGVVAGASVYGVTGFAKGQGYAVGVILACQVGAGVLSLTAAGLLVRRHLLKIGVLE